MFYTNRAANKPFVWGPLGFQKNIEVQLEHANSHFSICEYPSDNNIYRGVACGVPLCKRRKIIRRSVYNILAIQPRLVHKRRVISVSKREKKVVITFILFSALMYYLVNFQIWQ